MSRVYDVHTT